MALVPFQKMSQSCAACGDALERAPRNWFERLTAERVLACRGCHARVRTWRLPPLSSTARFVGSSKSRCIECGTSRVRRLPARDGLDRMSRHPISLLLTLTAAPIWYCSMCRVQYRDWRGVGVRVAVQRHRVTHRDHHVQAEDHSEAISA